MPGDWKTIDQREMLARRARKTKRHGYAAAGLGLGASTAAYAHGHQAGERNPVFGYNFGAGNRTWDQVGQVRRADRYMRGTDAGLGDRARMAGRMLRARPAAGVFLGGLGVAGLGLAHAGQGKAREVYHHHKLNQRRRANVTASRQRGAVTKAVSKPLLVMTGSGLTGKLSAVHNVARDRHWGGLDLFERGQREGAGYTFQAANKTSRRGAQYGLRDAVVPRQRLAKALKPFQGVGATTLGERLANRALHGGPEKSGIFTTTGRGRKIRAGQAGKPFQGVEQTTLGERTANRFLHGGPERSGIFTTSGRGNRMRAAVVKSDQPRYGNGTRGTRIVEKAAPPIGALKKAPTLARHAPMKPSLIAPTARAMPTVKTVPATALGMSSRLAKADRHYDPEDRRQRRRTAAATTLAIGGTGAATAGAVDMARTNRHAYRAVDNLSFLGHKDSYGGVQLRNKGLPVSDPQNFSRHLTGRERDAIRMLSTKKGRPLLVTGRAGGAIGGGLAALGGAYALRHRSNDPRSRRWN